MLHPEGFTKLAALAVLGAAALAAPVFASAAPTSEVQHVKAVQYGDLDLTKPADAERLYARIKRAAQEVCRNYQWSPVQADCYEAAVTEAVAKVHQPLLSAMVQRRGGSGRGAHAGA